MKTASHIARILLGLIFTVFGLNGFLHFIPLPLPSDVAGQFMGALFVSHYYVAVFAVQVAGGILLLSNRFRTARADATRTGHCFMKLLGKVALVTGGSQGIGRGVTVRTLWLPIGAIPKRPRKHPRKSRRMDVVSLGFKIDET